MRYHNYFELKRGKIYTCNLDDKDYNGKFEYKLYKHYLVYRKRTAESREEKQWRGVWNPDWYNDSKAAYKEIE